ncbi:YjbQ family protein [candidate division WOR-3 bacterium]|nr:YjbQ family protein [candidate division WOR-3 bacterium]
MAHSASIEVATEGVCDVRDITPELRAIVARSGVRTGTVCVANPGSTAGLTTVEYEPGAVSDLKELMERLVPQRRQYHHDATWGDANGFAHLRSALMGASLTLPVVDGEPALGTWQQVVLVDFDNRPRRRRLVVVVTSG